MERALEFVQNHPILFGILLALIVLYFFIESRRSGHKIAPQILGAFLTQNKAILIDLRDAKDFNAGHISGSRNIPYSRLKEHLQELRDLDTPIVMVCQMGQIAGHAVQQIGKPNVYRLDGGILSYKSQGLPLTKPRG